MLTTQEINFNSHYVLKNGVEVGMIHGVLKVDPVAGGERLMWEAWLGGQMIGETDSFMKTFRFMQNTIRNQSKAA